MASRGTRIPGKLSTELSTNTTECCCAYNMMKLTRHLFGWSPDARLMDYYERTLFNHRLGTINPEDGTMMYYLPLAIGVLENFRQTFRLLLVLHRHRIGRICKAHRYDLFPRRRLALRKSLHRLATGMARERAPGQAGDALSGGARNHAHSHCQKPDPTCDQSSAFPTGRRAAA